MVDGGIRKMNYNHQPVYLESDYGYLEWHPKALTFPATELYGDLLLRYYFKNFIAPIGTYQQFGFGIASGTIDKSVTQFDGSYYDYSLGGYVAVIKVEDVTPVKIKRLSYGLGIMRTLAGNIYLNFETNVHFAIEHPEKYYRKEMANINGLNESNYDQAVLNLNFSSYQRFDIKLGIGVLL